MLVASLLSIRAIVGQGSIFDICLVPRSAVFVEKDLIDALEGNVRGLWIEEVDQGDE